MDALSAHYGSPGRLVDYRRQFEKTTRSAGEDPSIFAIALETLVVKAFGDMSRTARLRLIRDCFIAGHSSCELRRYLDSVPPETPIQDVVERCRVWESHADPEIRRVSMPGPIYADKGVEEIQVAAVTKPKSTPDQMEDLFRRLLVDAGAPAPVPAPVPEVPVVEKLLERLVAERRFASLLRLWRLSLRDWRLCSDRCSRGIWRRCNSLDRDPSGVIGMSSCVSLVRRQVIVRLVVPLWTTHFLLCCQGGRPRRHRGTLEGSVQQVEPPASAIIEIQP